MKLLKATIFLLFVLSTMSSDIAIAEAPERELTPYELVSKIALEKGVDLKLAHYIAEHESHYKTNLEGDMNITCKVGVNKGKPVRARGIFQITQCYYPEFTDKQAFDPETNIRFAMDIIAKGKSTCMSQFTTCRWYYN
jgi:soluble lytic murein transglycosylase-like protein